MPDDKEAGVDDESVGVEAAGADDAALNARAAMITRAEVLAAAASFFEIAGGDASTTPLFRSPIVAMKSESSASDRLCGSPTCTHLYAQFRFRATAVTAVLYNDTRCHETVQLCLNACCTMA